MLSNDIIYRSLSGQGFLTTHHGNMTVNGSGSPTAVFKSTNTSTAAFDRIGVHGLSLPAPWYGIGVQGEGGAIGVKGVSTLSGTGSRLGISGSAQNGTTNYGAYGYAYGTGASTNYGIYGYASGGTTNYAGFFSGNVYCTGSYLPSDKRLKKNIADLNGSLAKIMKLSAKTYEYDIDNNPKMGLSTGKQIGLIAQEVEAIFPEVVKEVPVTLPMDTLKEEPKGKEEAKAPELIKTINYNELIPILVNAIQEQRNEIELLKTKINDN
jgi:hypothetical protein